MKISSNVKIGIIISISLFLLIWGINFLRGRSLFTRDTTFYAIYDRIGKLSESSPVTLNGFQIGQVNSISLTPDFSGKLVVEFFIRSDMNVPLKTVARISSLDLMGTMSIEMIFYDTAKYHKAGDTLLSSVEGSLKDMVSIQMLPIKNKAEDLMKEMQEAIEVVKYIFNPETRDDLRKSFSSITRTFENLENTSGAFDTILKTESRKLSIILSKIESIATNLKDNNEKLTNIIQNFSAITDSIAKSDLAGTIRMTYKVMSETNQIIEKINRGQGSVGLLINNDTLYYRLEQTSLKLNNLLQDIKDNPKKYVHFSLFDFGRTIEVNNNEKNKK